MPEIAKQETYAVEVGGESYKFPGLAFNPDGSITVASLIDVLLTAVAAPDQVARDEVLRANDIVVRDMDGKLFFPRPKAP